MYVYSVLTSTTKNRILDGLYSISISKNLYPQKEKAAADGNSYDVTRRGVCSMNFVNNMSGLAKIGDYVVVLRTPVGVFDRNNTSVGSSVLVDAWALTKSKIVFQGVIVHNGWSQFVGSGQNFTSMFNVKAYDLTHYFMDANFFPYSYFKSPYTPKWKYEKALKHYYDVDLDRTYQRDDLVNRLVINYVDKRLKHGSAYLNQLRMNLTNRPTIIKPGIIFEKSIGGYDYVSASDVFKTMSIYSSCWDYLSSLTSHPLFELFVREDTGELVFRRSCWDKPGSYTGRLLKSVSGGLIGATAGALGSVLDLPINAQTIENALTIRASESYITDIEKDDIVSIHIDNNWEGVSNAIQMASASDTLPMSTIEKGFHEKYGIKMSGQNDRPPKYNPALIEHSRLFGDAFKNAVQGDFARALGGLENIRTFGELEVQDDLLRRNIADIFRGTIHLKKYMDISIGDHIRIRNLSDWLSSLNNIGSVLEAGAANNPSALTLLIPGIGVVADLTIGILLDALKPAQNKVIAQEDGIFYVTGKELDATVAANGQMTETFKLTLNFGGLEFVTGYNNIHIKHT